jgi:hypothetical protein
MLSYLLSCFLKKFKHLLHNFSTGFENEYNRLSS